MALSQNLAQVKNSSFFTFYSMNIVLISHVLCHVPILLKIVNINVSNTSRLEWPSIALQQEIKRKNIILNAQI